MLSYDEALAAVRRTAETVLSTSEQRTEVVPLHKAVGRVVCEDLYSPISTPTFDSSAMDGFAVSSSLTHTASPTSPVFMKVVGIMAAGDERVEVKNTVEDNGLVPCVEIMTGAAFPISTSIGRAFDACIPYEHVSHVLVDGKPAVKKITAPARRDQHRRRAGGDFTKGNLIMEKGAVIRPSDVMALAGVGIGRVAVKRPVRASVLSTGSEVISQSTPVASKGETKTYDANGPYLTAALQSLGVEVYFHGIVADDTESLAAQIREECRERSIDMIITSGAVSAGKFDFVRTAVDRLDATIIFHHVAMRPGHPVLFATLGQGPSSISKADKGRDSPYKDLSPGEPGPDQQLALFALPGNPIATAATFRFLVLPYISLLQDKPAEVGFESRIWVPDERPKHCMRGPPNGVGKATASSEKRPPNDLFRHGTLRADHTWALAVDINAEQSPAKIRPFASSNCWVHVPRGHAEPQTGDVLRCFSLSGDPSGIETRTIAAHSREQAHE